MGKKDLETLIAAENELVELSARFDVGEDLQGLVKEFMSSFFEKGGNAESLPPFLDFLQEVYRRDARSREGARERTQALTDLRNALRCHLESLNKLKRQLAREKVPIPPSRRFPFDHPPN